MKHIIQNVINEIVNQSWTIFGLLVGWIVLPEGETKEFVGTTIAVLCAVWLLTMPLRIERNEG